MQGKTEIKINGLAYGIICNNLAIGEAFSRFGINPLSGEIKGIFAILKLIYCGMITYSEMNNKEVPTYESFLQSFDDNEIDQSQFEGIFKAFTESKVISDTLQKANEIAGESKKKVIPKKK